MNEAFNPYQVWLGLEMPQPNYYELLSLPPCEADLETIAVAADRVAIRVRNYRPGVNAAAWSRLLDEIHTAKECLLNQREKDEYDRRLREGDAGPVPAKPKEATRPAAPARDDRYPPGMSPAGTHAKDEAREPATPGAAPDWPAPAPQGSPGASVQPIGGMAAPYAAPLQHPPAYPYSAAAPYALPPGAAPYGVPQAAYPAPMAMPMGYPAAGAYGGYPAAVPMANPYGAMANPYGIAGGYPAAYPPGAAPLNPPPAPPPTLNEPVALAGGYSPPTSFDPMAPVAIPGMAAPNAVFPSPRVVGFAGAVGDLPPGAKQAVPVGTAVAAAGAIPMGTAVGSAVSATSPTALPSSTADPIGNVRRSSSASAAVMAAKRDKQSNHMLLLVGAGGALALFAAVAIVVVMNMGGEPVNVAQVPPVESNPAAIPQPIPRGIESTIPKVPPVRPTPFEPMPMPAPMQEPIPEPMTPAPMPETPMPAPMPAPASTPAPEPTPPPTPTPTPPPPPTPVPATPTVTKQEVISLGKALTTAKIALGEQNFEEADKQLALAEPLAKLPEHQAKYQRLKEVADYVKQFRGAVAEAVAGLDAGATFKVGTSTMVVVVETFPDKIIIRSLGQNKTYPFQDLPVGLAVAIVDMKLDTAAPANRVIKGAYLAVDKRGDSVALDKAKAFWEEAQLGGIDTTHLMPFLSDKYDELEKDISAEGEKKDSPAAAATERPGE